MRVYDIYQTALSFVSEKPKNDDLQSFVAGWMNLLLAEALPYENGLRRYKGMKELTDIPRVETIEDEVPFLYEICNPALVYGLASFIAQDDDNEYRTERYRQLYISALYDTQHYELGEIHDFYAEGSE